MVEEKLRLVEPDSWLKEHFWYVQFGLLAAGLCLRLIGINASGPALGHVLPVRDRVGDRRRLSIRRQDVVQLHLSRVGRAADLHRAARAVRESGAPAEAADHAVDVSREHAERRAKQLRRLSVAVSGHRSRARVLADARNPRTPVRLLRLLRSGLGLLHLLLPVRRQLGLLLLGRLDPRSQHADEGDAARSRVLHRRHDHPDSQADCGAT